MSNCDVIIIITSRAYGARGARSPVLIMMSFATELATPFVTDVRTHARTHYRV